MNKVYDIFYAQLLPCPTGLTLQNGVCNCDPNLPANFDDCYIDHFAIKRPANAWITAHSQGNNTKYSSECPMDYCLPYSSNVTVHAKTSLVCTKIEIHFLSSAYSYTH